VIYRTLIRPLVFRFDSETVHHLAVRSGKLPGVAGVCRALYHYADPGLATEVFGLKFASPIGLSAGFDKNCELVPTLAALGFSHIELGSVTAAAQPGNPRPRIFRLPEDGALINRMGFPSVGVDVFAPRLRQVYGSTPAVIGVNIGKTKVVPIDAALVDYVATFTRVRDSADYFVLNVSSPNTPELRKLQERDRLTALLQGVQAHNPEKKPLLVKIAPDLSWAEIDAVLLSCNDADVAGIIATNTTFSRAGLRQAIDEVGGLSGAPLHSRAVEIVRYITTQTAGKLPVIGVGGVFSAADVIDFLRAGASLVQLYTGLIYRGPAIVREINCGLSRYLAQEGLKSIAEIKSKIL
jgi:dihydroorotate dehydrogenase